MITALKDTFYLKSEKVGIKPISLFELDNIITFTQGDVISLDLEIAEKTYREYTKELNLIDGYSETINTISLREKIKKVFKLSTDITSEVMEYVCTIFIDQDKEYDPFRIFRLPEESLYVAISHQFDTLDIEPMGFILGFPNIHAVNEMKENNVNGIFFFASINNLGIDLDNNRNYRLVFNETKNLPERLYKIEDYQYEEFGKIARLMKDAKEYFSKFELSPNIKRIFGYNRDINITWYRVYEQEI